MKNLYNVGDKLKKARMQKGYTLDDMQQITKIQKRYLAAIEDGNLEILPGDFYVRAFIKQYGDTVGLNGDQLVNEYNNPNDADNHEGQENEDTGEQTYSRVKSNSQGGILAILKDSGPVFLVIAVLIAIVIAIYLATTALNYEGNFLNETENPEMIQEESESSEGSNSESSAQSESGESDQGSTSNQSIEYESADGTNIFFTVSGPHPDEQEIEISANGGESWVQVNVDGESGTSQTLYDGDSITEEFTGDAEQVIVTAGNAPSTEITLNGQQVDYITEENRETVEQVQMQYVVFNFE